MCHCVAFQLVPTFRRNLMHLSPSAKESKKSYCLCKRRSVSDTTQCQHASILLKINWNGTDKVQHSRDVTGRRCNISVSELRYWERQSNRQSGYVISESRLEAATSSKRRKGTTHLVEMLGKESSTYRFLGPTLTPVILKCLEKQLEIIAHLIWI